MTALSANPSLWPARSITPLTPTATGVYGALDGTIVLNLPGDLNFTAPVIRLQFNTTTAQHSVSIDSESVTLAAQTIRPQGVLGQVVATDGTERQLAIDGQAIERDRGGRRFEHDPERQVGAMWNCISLQVTRNPLQHLARPGQIARCGYHRQHDAQVSVACRSE